MIAVYCLYYILRFLEKSICHINFKMLVVQFIADSMAAASTKKSDDSEEEFLECGLCYENDNLKRLPCSPGHIFCVTCLTKDSEVTKIIKCAICR